MARKNMRGLGNTKDEKQPVEEDVVEKQAAWRIKLASILRTLKIGKHYKMERFMILLGASLFTLLLFTTVALVKHRGDVAHLTSAQALFTESFVFSLSDERVHVESISGDKKRTDVMVLLRLGNPERLSTDAKNYELFITGERGPLDYEPDVSLSMFGSTGYAIIRVQSTNGQPLPKEIMEITIRSNAWLSDREGSGTSGEDDDMDGSFAKYDQGKLYINPGAENVHSLENFKAGADDPSKLYIALVANARDKAIRAEITDHTIELGKLLNRAKEYTNRLDMTGYKPPAEPWFIKGDYIDDDGVFRPASDVMRAHKFDYYTQTIHEGYIRQVMRDFSDYEKYMRGYGQIAGDSSAREEMRREQFDRAETIEHEDGTVVSISMITTGASPSTQVAAKDALESLESTWRLYVRTKAKIQRDSMRSLLILDADVLAQSTGFSTNKGKDAVVFY